MTGGVSLGAYAASDKGNICNSSRTSKSSQMFLSHAVIEGHLVQAHKTHEKEAVK